MKIPDYISPIVGYRVWFWSNNLLASLNGEPWLPYHPLKATCAVSPPGGLSFGPPDQEETRDASNLYHGYVRTPHGNITTFDVPGAGTGAFQGTVSAGIDPARTIAGEYFDASNVFHGFVRTKRGDITTFDVSVAGSGSGQGTIPNSINTPGAITGQKRLLSRRKMHTYGPCSFPSWRVGMRTRRVLESFP